MSARRTDQVEGSPRIRVPGHFETFYREEYPAVVALIYVLFGNRHVSEDLAQEAFLRAYSHWQRVGSMDSPAAWVRHVAINLGRSRFRRLRSEAAVRSRLTTREAALDPLPTEHDAFWAEVRRLPLRQAQAIALRYVDDYSIAQIADVLKIAEGTVKALLFQGRERLERQLQMKGWTDEDQ